MKKQLKQAKEKFDKTLLSNKTTLPFWRKVRNVAGGIAMGGIFILSSGITLPAIAATTLTITTGVAIGITTGAHASDEKRNIFLWMKNLIKN
jgi:hypothetical protein